MSWMMLFFAIPLVLLLIFGLGGQAAGLPSWAVWGFVILMAAGHLFTMRSHNPDAERSAESSDDTQQQQQPDKHNDAPAGRSCCH